MKKNSLIYDDEIDLLALFKIIWNGKIKILLITIISFLVGFGYNSQIPINYLNSVTINVGKSSSLIKIDYIEKLLNLEDSKSENQANANAKANEQAILNLYLNRFINELKDYEEFLLNLKNTKKIQDNFSKIKIENQQIELFKYSQLLKIVKSKNKNERQYIINFYWHDPDEAKKILQDTLYLTSLNLKKSIVKELFQSVEFTKKKILGKDSIRVAFLKEQSAIARELSFLNNQLDNRAVANQSNLSLNINTADNAYYLRGYKAIEKEIQLIENREYENLKYVEQEINSFNKESVKWVDYNIYLMNSELLKNTKLILLISILLGLVFGIFYVLISNASQVKKSKKIN